MHNEATDAEDSFWNYSEGAVDPPILLVEEWADTAP